MKPCFDILMGVGTRYYPDPAYFIEECLRLGLNKRIAEFPKFFCPRDNLLFLVHWRTRTIFAYVANLTFRVFSDAQLSQILDELEKRPWCKACDKSCVIKAPPGAFPEDSAERGCGHVNTQGRYLKRSVKPRKPRKKLDEFFRKQYDGGSIMFLENDKQLFRSLQGPWKKLRSRLSDLKKLISKYAIKLLEIHQEWSHDQLYYCAKALALHRLMQPSGPETNILPLKHGVMLSSFSDIVVLYKSIPYVGPFTRGYRYIRVDLENCKYTIIKIKVKKKTKKERSLLDYTSYNTETKRVFPLKQDKQYIRINTPSSVLPGDDDE